MRGFRYAIAAVCGLLLGGCAPTKVTDIAKDEDGYMARTFTVEGLSKDVRDQLVALGPVNPPFKTMTFDMDVTIHKNDPSTADTADLHETAVVHVENVGGGFTRTRAESFNNGIPTYLVMELSYLNFIWLTSQSITYGYQRPQAMVKADKITRIDPGWNAPKPQATYEADQRLDSKSYEFSCVAGNYHAATEVFPALQGRALDLDCTSSVDGVINTKSKEEFLESYGIYMITERDQSNAVSVFKITGVKQD